MSVALRPATEQMTLLQTGKISPAELAEEHLRRIERLNPALNALVEVQPERVRAQAATPVPGPLSGLPLTIKSSIEVEGYRCEIGSELNQGQVADSDARAVASLRRAGAVILGTTNCPEFLMAYETDGLLHGAANNPWDLSRNAGGSSGGEAAAVAAGLSAGGVGSDSGGSVREPAHFTGICALKPTPGRISSEGHRPPCVGPFSSLGSLGPMARTIGDVALLFRVLSEDALQPGLHRPVSLTDARQAAVAVLEDDGHVPVTPDTRTAVQMAARELERAGFRVERIEAPSYLEEARKLWRAFFLQCGAMFYEGTLHGRRERLSSTFRDFLAESEREGPLSAGALLEAWAAMDTLRIRFLEETREMPLLLTPVCSVPAFRAGERSWSIDGQEVGYWDAMRFTQWFNLLAAPAAVVPVSASAEGLPIGVQVAGRPHEDELVLAVAGVLDGAFGYRVPPFARG